MAGHHSVQELTESFSAARKARIAASTDTLRKEIALQDLRQRSEKELASELSVGQKHEQEQS